MIAQEYRDEMVRLMETVLEEIGPRESCGEAEHRLGETLRRRWSELGLTVECEPFRCHPRAFLGFIPFSVGLYLVAAACYWAAPGLAVAFAAGALVLTIFELLRQRELVDPLFPEAEGRNVVARIPAPGECRRRVIVSAHQDSAYEFNLWYFLKNASIPLMVVAFAAPAVPLLGGLAQLLGASADTGLVHGLGVLSLALYPVVGLNLFFHTFSVVPGAMDDLAGIAVLDGVARVLADPPRGDGTALAHTEVVLLATSAEEAGLRGARRFAEAHRSELHAVPCHVLNVDGVYDERFLTAIELELALGVRHDPRLVALAERVATRRGWKLRRGLVPFGGTDAAAFARAGVSSVSLLCQDISRLAPNYHTRLDTLERVRPDSLTVMLQLVLDMIEEIDAGALDIPAEAAGERP
jgi:acetylornithine deacetylase/succinyl-diaminopimelate desuccinylase-like protein